MVQNPLIIYNTSIPESLRDGHTYLVRRGLPINQVGVNFTNSPATVVNNVNVFDGTFTVQPGTFFWGGIQTTAYDGQPIGFVLQGAFPRTHPVDAILCSTFTPFTYTDIPLRANYPLAAQFALFAWVAQNGSGSNVLPNGRLGCPATHVGNPPTFDFTVEMTPRNGGAIWSQCLTNALAAEGRYNLREPHFLSSTGGPFVVSGSPGFNSAYWPTLMAAARSRKCSWTVDLCNDYPAGLVQADDFFNGTVGSPLDLFALCAPFNLNGAGVRGNAGDTAQPGAHVYSANYRVRPGGWSCHWFSFQWYWAMDFLYNGGSAALLTVQEPFETGIRDPKQFLTNMVDNRLSLAECLPLVSSPVADSFTAVAFSHHQTIIGDPLYRPYLTQVLNASAAPPPGLMV